ncbi:MAG: DUF4105 domain-containing protein [Deltaproteobacteria bacterium]|nr:DUF4105 domain-containing protein [Deltaproteobacteria bacterium]
MNRLAIVVLSLSVLLTLALTPRTASAEPGDEYTISVLTMSPGDPVFFKFGHNAIWVHDARTLRDDVYNWGTFSFDEPGLIQKFLRGRLTYWLSVQGIRGTIAQYDYEGRYVQQQELDLTAAQKRKVVAAMRDNALPANAKYRYHYYRDNCSTRVRDMIDLASDGALKAVSSDPSPFTYRGETSRLTADVLWAYTFLTAAMGSFIDQPITMWEDQFVPERVEQMLRKATVRKPDGRVVPLVKAERRLVEADRQPPRADLPQRTLGYLATGTALGALFGWLAYRVLTLSRREGTKAPLGLRLALGLPLGAITTLTAFLGLLFLFFWTLTDHEVAYHNENLLQTNPITVAMPIIAIGLMRGSRWAARAFERVALALATMSVIGLLLKAMPWWFKQVNGEIIALLLPLWLGLAAAAWMARTGELSALSPNRRGAPGGARARTAARS